MVGIEEVFRSKWAPWILAALAALVSGATAVGWMLPLRHEAAVRFREHMSAGAVAMEVDQAVPASWFVSYDAR